MNEIARAVEQAKMGDVVALDALYRLARRGEACPVLAGAILAGQRALVAEYKERGEVEAGMPVLYSINGDSYGYHVVAVRRNGREMDIVRTILLANRVLANSRGPLPGSVVLTPEGERVQVPDLPAVEVKTVTLRKDGRYYIKGRPMTGWGGYQVGVPVHKWDPHF